MSTDSENIAERLRRFADSKFGSVNALADALGMAPSSLRSNYLSGRSMPGGKMLIQLAVQGCDPMWLLTGIGNPPDLNEVEIERYIEHLKRELSTMEEKLRLYREVRRNFIRQMQEDGVIGDDELPVEYKVKKRRRKKE